MMEIHERPKQLVPNNYIRCTACSFKKLKHLKACPRCEDRVLRSFDTATKMRSGDAR